MFLQQEEDEEEKKDFQNSPIFIDPESIPIQKSQISFEDNQNPSGQSSIKGQFRNQIDRRRSSKHISMSSIHHKLSNKQKSILKISSSKNSIEDSEKSIQLNHIPCKKRQTVQRPQGIKKKTMKTQAILKTKYTIKTILSADSGMEDSRISKLYYNKVMVVDYSCLLFALIGMLLSLLYVNQQLNQFSIKQDLDYYQSNEQLDFIILMVIFVTTVITSNQLYNQILKLYAPWYYGKKQCIYTKDANLLTTGLYRDFLLEAALLLLQPYPFFNNEFFNTWNLYQKTRFKFKVNWLLGILTYNRIYIILRVLIRGSRYMNPRASRLCRVYGTESDYSFALKCIFKDYPMIALMANIFIGLFLFAAAFRIFERPINPSLDNLINAFWMSLVTMTTVGYGDYSPQTLMGRIITIFLIVWGNFSTSVLVVIITNKLQMISQESKTVTLYNKLNAREELVSKAGSLLTMMLKQRIRGKKDSNQWRQFLKEFKELKRQYKNIFDVDDIVGELLRQFEYLLKEVKELLTRDEKLKLNMSKYFTNTLEERVNELYETKYKSRLQEMLFGY